MSRWQELVDNVLTNLETETPGADGFRVGRGVASLEFFSGPFCCGPAI